MATARRFAVAMGMVALAVVCVGGILRQSPLQDTLLRALVALLVFAAIGYACGLLGAAIMRDAVHSELTRVRDARDARGGIGRTVSRRGGKGGNAGTASSATGETPGDLD